MSVAYSDASHFHIEGQAALVAAALPQLNERIALCNAAPPSRPAAAEIAADPGQPHPVSRLLRWAAQAAAALCSRGGQAAQQLIAVALQVRGRPPHLTRLPTLDQA